MEVLSRFSLEITDYITWKIYWKATWT